MKALMAAGSLRWSCRFSRGPLPVTMAWTKNPNMENIACSNTQHLSEAAPDRLTNGNCNKACMRATYPKSATLKTFLNIIQVTGDMLGI